MKKNWVEQVKLRIAQKAEINAKHNKSIETIADHASKKIGIPSLLKSEHEDMISYTGRLVKHFGLGHDCDAKVPDAAARKRRQAAQRNYQNRRMGFR